MILTNKPLSFQKTIVTETGLSDFHKLISTFFKSHYTQLKPKIIKYRNYKNFEERAFLEDLEKTDFLTSGDDPNKKYDTLTNVFKKVVEKHAPLKKKVLRGNHAPFITKNLRKEIYTRSRFRNRFWKNPSDENKILYEKQRNKCVSLS